MDYIAIPLSYVAGCIAAGIVQKQTSFHGKVPRCDGSKAKARRLYTQIVLVLLLLFHYVFTNGHIGEFGVVLSTIVCAVMFSSKRVDKWLRYLLDRPRAFAVYALVAVVIGFVPHLYTMAVTIAFILLAALFYPSSKSLSEPEDGNEGVGRTKHAETSANSYSDNHHAGLPR